MNDLAVVAARSPLEGLDYDALWRDPRVSLRRDTQRKRLRACGGYEGSR